MKRKRNRCWVLIWLGIILIFIGWGCQTQGGVPTLRIATAANMQFAMKELADAFSEETGISCETIVGSSGKLTAQIREGAPFDVFVSANMVYPNALNREGLTTGPPEIYAYGCLVLWWNRMDRAPTPSDLTSDRIRHVALANPKTAPYGMAAGEWLEHNGLLEKIEQKLVFGESIAQTNRFITSGAADLGFTSKSIVVSSLLSGKGSWVELDSARYSPIVQGAVMLTGNLQPLRAKRFYDFLFSAKAATILTKFGYTIPEPQHRR